MLKVIEDAKCSVCFMKAVQQGKYKHTETLTNMTTGMAKKCRKYRQKAINYLNQSSLIIKSGLWHLLVRRFKRNAHKLNL